MSTFLNQQILISLIVLPLLAGIGGLVLIPSTRKTLCKIWSGLILAIEFVLSVHLLAHFQPGNGLQFQASYQFHDVIPFHFTFGVDGISIWLILLTTFLLPLVVLGCWNQIKQHIKGFLICLFVIETAVIGVLVSLNLILFYVFWELIILPMFLMINIWGSGRHQYSAMKFFLFTTFGSFPMLIAIVYLSLQTDPVTYQHLLSTSFSTSVQTWCFLAFLLSFAVKIPIFPLHTWLPDAHTDAPTGGSVLLAGVLLKLGVYGIIRFAIPLFPEGFVLYQNILIVLGIIGILYGGLMCLLQNDIKRLIAYSSISHLGFVVFGIASNIPQAEAGAQFLMISHGLTTGGLFLLIGMLYERTHSRKLDTYSGLAETTPWLSFFFILIALGSIGVPGMSGFVGEFLVLLGGFQLSSSLYAAFAVLGVILAAWYMLRLIRSVFFGPPEESEHHDISDLNIRELSVIVPISLLIIYFGMDPMFILETLGLG